MPTQITVTLDISRENYLLWYSGSVKDVLALSHAGQRVRFPANILQPFITHTGIHGTFVIEHTEHGKFRSIQRIA